MDDFFDSMKSVLMNIEENNNNQIESSSSNGWATSTSSSSIFVEALAPVNPARWMAWSAGNGFAAIEANSPPTNRVFGTGISAGGDTLHSMYDFLDSSYSDVQYRDRLWRMVEDTAIVNTMCEVGGDPGAFLAGIYAHNKAEEYELERAETMLTISPTEQLNLLRYQQYAKESSYLQEDLVQGTGIFREYVPEFMRSDLCHRPERNSRPGELDEPFDPPFTGTGNGKGPTGPVNNNGDGSGIWWDSNENSNSRNPDRSSNSKNIDASTPDDKPSIWGKALDFLKVNAQEVEIGASGAIDSTASISSADDMNLEDSDGSSSEGGMLSRCMDFLGFGEDTSDLPVQNSSSLCTPKWCEPEDELGLVGGISDFDPTSASSQLAHGMDMGFFPGVDPGVSCNNNCP